MTKFFGKRFIYPASLFHFLLWALSLSSLFLSYQSHVAGADDFIRRDGTQFTLNGQPFYVTGANSHYLGWGADVEIDNLLDDAAAMNFNVIRTFISVVRGTLDGSKPAIWQWDRNDNSSNLGMNGVYFLYWDGDHMAWNDGPNGLQRIDQLIAKAKKRNIRLLFSLLDFYDYTGGSQQMSAWYGSTDRYTFFFKDERTRADYEAWVRHVLERTNTITGIAYKDDPTIFGWDLMNEAQFSSVDLATDWITEMSAYIKSIDPNHMLGLGSEGFFDGKSGNDPLNQLKIDTVDFGTWHIYPAYHRVSPQDVINLNKSHCDVATQANKPVLFEEFGYGAQHADQASVYQKWLESVRANPNCAGWVMWRFTARMKNGSYPRDEHEHFDVHNDNSATAQVFRSAALAGRNSVQVAQVEPTIAPTLPPLSRFVMGIDLNGGQLDIDGNLWRSYQLALKSGLSVSGATIDKKVLPKQPEATATTSQMLDTLIYSSQEMGTLSITQETLNGKYLIYLWVMENYQSNSRSFDLYIQGKSAAKGLGDLPLNNWVKYGPFSATVDDGILRLDLQPKRGRAILMGFALYTNPS